MSLYFIRLKAKNAILFVSALVCYIVDGWMDGWMDGAGRQTNRLAHIICKYTRQSEYKHKKSSGKL